MKSRFRKLQNNFLSLFAGNYYSIETAKKYSNQNAVFGIKPEEIEEGKEGVVFSASSVCGERNEDQDSTLLKNDLYVPNPKEFLAKQIDDMVDDIRGSGIQDGTTASLYYLDLEKGEITVANLGDSRVYITIEHQGVYKTILLTEDHSLEFLKMQERARNNGALVSNKEDGTYRLRDGNSLNMSHAIGDGEDDGVLRKPDINTFAIADLVKIAFPDAKIEDCNFTVINACDGITDHMNDGNYDLGVEYDDSGKLIPGRFVEPDKLIMVYDKTAKSTGFISIDEIEKNYQENPKNPRYSICLYSSEGEHRLVVNEGVLRSLDMGVKSFELEGVSGNFSIKTYGDNEKSKISGDVKRFAEESKKKNHNPYKELSKNLTTNALWHSSDNITATTCHFSGKYLTQPQKNNKKKRGICGGIFDGHGYHGSKVSRRCMGILSRSLSIGRKREALLEMVSAEDIKDTKSIVEVQNPKGTFEGKVELWDKDNSQHFHQFSVPLKPGDSSPSVIIKFKVQQKDGVEELEFDSVLLRKSGHDKNGTLFLPQEVKESDKKYEKCLDAAIEYFSKILQKSSQPNPSASKASSEGNLGVVPSIEI